MRLRFTVGQLLLANVVAVVVLVWMIRLCNGGDLFEFDAGKMGLTVAVVFGMPGVLAWSRWRVGGEDRRRAVRVAAGFHCALMVILCSVPPAYWAHYLLIERRAMWVGAWQHFHRTFEPSLILAGLYAVAGVLAFRASARRPRSPSGRTRAGR